MNKIVFATTNKGKLREARQILGIQVDPLELQVDEIQTLDPVECVKKKAQAAYNQVEIPILVEDTSLFINGWGKLPGVFIDYFMKSLGNQGILKLLNKEKKRSALVQTTLCYFDGKKSIIVSGKIKGRISEEEKGKNGFGWDPIFIPKGKDKTFAEMKDKEKNSLSMRKIALEKLKKKLFI